MRTASVTASTHTSGATWMPSGSHPAQRSMQPPTVLMAVAWEQQGSVPPLHPSTTAVHAAARVSADASHERPAAAAGGGPTGGATPGTTGTVGGSVLAGAVAQPGDGRRVDTPGASGRFFRMVSGWAQPQAPAGAATTAPDAELQTNGTRRAPIEAHPD